MDIKEIQPTERVFQLTLTEKEAGYLIALLGRVSSKRYSSQPAKMYNDLYKILSEQNISGWLNGEGFLDLDKLKFIDE